MEKKLLTLSSLDFLIEITRQSLDFYKDSTLDIESDKVAIEAEFNPEFLLELLDKLRRAKTELSGNKVLSDYIDFRCGQIEKALNNNSVSAYSQNPQYGIQYFGLMHEILCEKKRMLNSVPD